MLVLVGAPIHSSPTIAPASGAAVWSTIVTIATALGVRETLCAKARVPVTAVVAADVGTAQRPAISPTASIAAGRRRRIGRDGLTDRTSRTGRRRRLRAAGPRSKPSRLTIDDRRRLGDRCSGRW